MSMMDKFLGSMRLNMDEADEMDDYEEDEIYDEPREKKSLFGKKKTSYNEDDDMSDFSEPSPERSRKASRNTPKVVPMRTARQSEVSMVMPRSHEDATQIADLLLEGKSVVLNLEGMNVDAAQRIIDFASGACYTMNGNLQKISKKIFIATPSSVELSGDFSDLLGGESINLNSLNLNQ